MTDAVLVYVGLIFGGILVAVVTALVAAGIVIVVQRFTDAARERHDGYVDAIGMVFAVVGVLYAIVLAFVVITVWDQMGSARQDSFTEATALVDVYAYAENVQDPARSEIQLLARSYAEQVIRDEWPAMQHHESVPLNGWNTLDRLREAVRGTGPHADASDATVDSYEAAMNALTTASEARTARATASTRGLPLVMWFLLVGGGLLTIAFAYLFDIAGLVSQLIFTVGLTVMVVLLLYAVYQLEYPFARGERIEADAFRFALARFAQLSG
ncbi:putative membrane protein [Hamadaea flava]|uniref:DUF4239 domain-containing protein n=1 Tax=Hamadaea flava TaxID=1742688 RepID=A0ABV8LEZ8_9ACTN|nr:DUF4239 domain-containing protein [Hamadaea flava]MCP2326219.1 putative membrane protein [Hamadaea flava]